MNQVIRVMIVDDHPMVRKGLSMFVAGSEGMQLVGEASNAADAVQMYDEHLPDVTLMDMVMPEGNGAEAIARIRRKHPDAAIVALTSYGDEELIEAAIKAGARGFMYKNVSVEELADVIRQVARGRTILDTKASDIWQKMVNEQMRQPSPVKVPLSERETGVLQLLVEGLTNKQIAARLNIQPSTVKQYASNILSKLNVQSRTEAVAMALKLGLVKK